MIKRSYELTSLKSSKKFHFQCEILALCNLLAVIKSKAFDYISNRCPNFPFTEKKIRINSQSVLHLPQN